ncbi:MAG: DHHW family protein [Acutalibacteraceae bacterium]
MTLTQKSTAVRTVTACIFCVLLCGMLLLFVLLPDNTFSETEKRVLADFPKLSLSSVADGSFEKSLETYVQDQMPFRNFWVGLGSYFNFALGQNGTDGVYAAEDGYLINTPAKQNDRNLQSNLKYLKSFAQKVQIPSYLMPVPETGYILEDKLPPRHKMYNDDAVFAAVSEKTDGVYTVVDLRALFKANAADKQLYYKTDHHWTSDGAFLAANAFLRAAGKSTLNESDFTVERCSGFFGTTYSKAALWKKLPDVMELWHIPDAKVHTVVSDLGKGVAAQADDVFFREHLQAYDMYPTYLNGNHSLTHIVNPQAPEGVLLLLKDSFGNTLATELAAAYREIVMVDMRYYRTEAASDLVAQYGVDTLLVNYSTDSLVNDTNILFLK